MQINVGMIQILLQIHNVEVEYVLIIQHFKLMKNVNIFKKDVEPKVMVVLKKLKYVVIIKVLNNNVINLLVILQIQLIDNNVIMH